jgi:hypothetical protein
MIQKKYQTVPKGYGTEQAAMEAFVRAAYYLGVDLGILVGKTLVDFFEANQ